jgi:hypothetical protein
MEMTRFVPYWAYWGTQPTQSSVSLPPEASADSDRLKDDCDMFEICRDT